MKEVHSVAMLFQVHSNIWTITALLPDGERESNAPAGAAYTDNPDIPRTPNIRVERRAMVVGIETGKDMAK